jgi:hypothetical protein
LAGSASTAPSSTRELVAKSADMTAKETAKEHGRQLKEATATTYQRHRIRQRLATGAWHDFHENKIARLPYVDPSTEYAATHASPPAGVGRTVESRETQSSTFVYPWDAWSGRLGRGAHALWRRPPAPAARAAGERRGRPNASASLAERAAATHIDSTPYPLGYIHRRFAALSA